MMKKFYTFLCLLFLGFGVQASEINNVKITRMMMDSNYGTKLFIQVEGTPARASGHCHVNGTWDYAVDTSNEFGKQISSQILTAYIVQKSVKMSGSDQCTVHSSVEDFKRIVLL
jgi:hypothetical protein